MPPQALSPSTRRRDARGPEEPNFVWLHELTREVFKLTLALAGVAAQLEAVDARPVLASIHQLDHGIVQLREAFLLHIEGSASSPSLLRFSDDIELVELVDQLNDSVGRAVQTTLRVAVDETHYEMIVEAARQVRRTIGA